MRRIALPLALVACIVSLPLAQASTIQDVANVLERISRRGVCVNADEGSVSVGTQCTPNVPPPAEAVEAVRASTCLSIEDVRRQVPMPPVVVLPGPSAPTPTQHACTVNVWNLCEVAPDACGSLGEDWWNPFPIIIELCGEDLREEGASCGPLPPDLMERLRHTLP